ncbi:DUF461 domain-containing protein [Streptomyces sp. 3MP-14]|uniref:DUF461 domain-containing protein n=1 Tax=Streptomyces mimosae TaxID=2586635 RepID=A0A5N6ADX4_9ACTN|nr:MULTISPECIES: DUF461 domain-containing protein [Streptomyces]KAB8167027.1 DUF461 domain-containing protein [Streptomyces mimosae]KAB8176968.1 DUF461 domain-containing protein [Streptomyces sp. 3MP-14]
MSSSLRRGVAAAFFAFPLFALTACAAGHDAETNNVRPDNASAQVDEIKVQSVNVILPEGEDRAGLSARLINNGTEDQTLRAVALADSGQQLELLPAEGETSVTVPAGGSVALGGEGNATAVLTDPEGAEVRLGNAQRLVFVLSETGEVSLSARVVPASGAFAYYEAWAPPPAEEEPVEEAPAEEETPADEGTEGAAGDEGADGAAEPGQDAEADTDQGTDENVEDPEAPADGAGSEATEGTEATEGVEGEQGVDAQD